MRRSRNRSHTPPARRNAAVLGGRALDVLLRDDRHTVEAALSVRHVVGEPVVVGPALCRRELGIPHTCDPEQHRRVDDRARDPVGVHVGEPRSCVVRRGPNFGVAKLAALRALSLFECHARRSREREPAREHALPVVDAPLRAVGVGLDVPDPVGELGGRVLQHPVRVLENVTIRVDVLQWCRGGHRAPRWCW